MSEGSVTLLHEQEVDTAISAEVIARREALLEKARKLQEKLVFKGNPKPEKALLLTLIKKIPFLAGLLRSINGTGSSFIKLAIVQGQVTHTTKVLGAGFHWAGLALSIIDFLRIPAIYFAAFLLGQKPPISLSKNARWLYSAVSLSMAITAMVVPAAAPPIALAMASLGLVVCVFLLAKHLYDRHKTKKALVNLEQEISQQEQELRQLQAQVAQIELQLQSANTTKLSELEEQLSALEVRIGIKKEKIQLLYDKQLHLQQKLEKINVASVVNKTVTIALATLGMIGLTLSLFFPPVGFIILISTAVASGAYLLGCLAFPLCKSLINFVAKKFNKPSTLTIAGEQADGLQVGTQYQTTNHDSTAVTMIKMFGETGAIGALREQVLDSKRLGRLYSQIGRIVAQEDGELMLQLFENLALSACQQGTSLDEIQGFLQHEVMVSALDLLKKAIKEETLPEKSKAQILAYEPLVTALQQKGINLAQIATQEQGFTAMKLSSSEDERERDGEGLGSAVI